MSPEWAYKLQFHRGWSIPNDTDEKAAQTTAKTSFAGCDMTWAKQNSNNTAVSKEKLEKGRWYRNTDEVPTFQRALKLLKTLGGGFSECVLLTARWVAGGLTSAAHEDVPSSSSKPPGEEKDLNPRLLI